MGRWLALQSMSASENVLNCLYFCWNAVIEFLEEYYINPIYKNVFTHNQCLKGSSNRAKHKVYFRQKYLSFSQTCCMYQLQGKLCWRKVVGYSVCGEYSKHHFTTYFWDFVVRIWAFLLSTSVSDLIFYFLKYWIGSLIQHNTIFSILLDKHIHTCIM